MDRNTNRAEIPKPPDGCCQVCEAELGLGLHQERRAVGGMDICLSCAQTMDAETSFDERPIYHTHFEVYP